MSDPAQPSPVTMQHRAPHSLPASTAPPAPLAIRPARIEEAAELATLLGRAFPSETWETAGTREELFGDPTVQNTWVICEGDQLQATASLQIRADDPGIGWLRWVATDSSRRRQGLARVLVIQALNAAARSNCRAVRLHTETDRHGAIALYLQLGFEPFVESESERKLWQEVLRRTQGA